MRLIVKDNNNIRIIERISPFVRDDIPVLRYNDLSDIMLDDMIICSRDDPFLEQTDRWRYKFIVFEDIYDSILKNMDRDYRYYYHYYHLDYELRRSGMEKIDTLITGNSYGLFGIDPKGMQNAVNLSMISQDLYYSLRVLYQAFDANDHVKNIVIFAPYYFFHGDLSRETNQTELIRIANVYDRIFGDIHSCELIPPRYEILYKSCVFDIPKMQRVFVESECIEGFFNKRNTRQGGAYCLWEKKERKWQDLSVMEKTEAGKQRAINHMKATRYKNSLMENRIFFKDFMQFAEEKKANVFILIPPHTDYYLSNVSELCRSEYYSCLDETNAIVLDYSDDNRFTDEDFVDMDHLSDCGARKLTRYLNDDLNRMI